MAHLSHAPTLLLSPEQVRDRNGTVAPTFGGATTVVDGRYGRAWRMEESTTNLAINPSAEVDLTGWTASGSATVTRVSGISAKGSFYVNVACPDTSNSEGVSLTTPTALNYTGSVRTFVGSAYLKAATAGTLYSFRLRVYYTDATFVDSTLKSVSLTTSWQRFETNTIATNSAKTVNRFEVLMQRNTSAIETAAWTFHADAVQIEEKAAATTYADGSLGTGHQWNGTAHASTSTRNLPLIDTPVGAYVTPEKGTVLIRYKKIVNTQNNNFLFAIGAFGTAGYDAFGINTFEMKHRIWWRRGTEAVVETPLASREAITLGTWETSVVRWQGTTWEQRISNGTPSVQTRPTPLGQFQGDIRLSLGNPANSANADIESVLVYEDYLEDHEIDTLLGMQGSWTWANVQPFQSSVPNVIQATSYRMVPRMFLADRHNVLGEEISAYVEKGNVEYNPDRAIKFTMKAMMSDDVVRPYADFLAPFLTIEYDDGYEVTSQLGLYGVVPPNETHNQQSKNIDIDGRDLTWLLSLDVFDAGYSVAAGTNIVTAVRIVLATAGFTRINIQESARTLSVARSWKAGTSKLQVINDLLTGAGYYSLTCGKDGTFISIPYVSVVNPTVVVEYDTTKPSYVKVVRDVKKDTTQDRIANKVVVIKDNASEAPIVATKINSNPNSPTSTVNLGMTIAKVVTDANVVDAASADVIATKYLEEASQQYNKISLYTWPDVERDVNEVYRLNIVNSLGETVADGLWRCRGWKIGFRPSDGPMQHDLSNIDTPPMEV